MESSNRSKIAITVATATLKKVDRLVKARLYPNRSRAIEAAVEDKLQRLDLGRLARECAKLDAAAERSMAEQGLSEDVAAWPEY
jgi:metal-responsive CopG/Arc/MetJ family transcriptional regulator